MKLSNASEVWSTPDGDFLIGKMARVSNPDNQDNPKVSGLISYCIKNKHWSIFEMCNLCVEIKTTRAIARQILRHKSFSFQEFSQRYARVYDWQMPQARRQDHKNRQNSIDDLDDYTKAWWYEAVDEFMEYSFKLYNEALNQGIAKESARFILPESVMTTLYMNGNVRSWIHYLELRSGNGTQLEHQEVALAIMPIFTKCYPTVAEALGWV